jgi:hypothetical protein
MSAEYFDPDELDKAWFRYLEDTGREYWEGLEDLYEDPLDYEYSFGCNDCGVCIYCLPDPPDFEFFQDDEDADEEVDTPFYASAEDRHRIRNHRDRRGPSRSHRTDDWGKFRKRLYPSKRRLLRIARYAQQ